MFAQIQGVAFAHNDAAVGIIGTEEVLHHTESLEGGYYGGFGVQIHEVGHIGSMIRLHVLHDQIVGLAVAQNLLQIIQPLVGEVLIYGIHNGDLVVQDHIGIVGHTVGHNILALEQIYLMVVYTDVFDVVGNEHSNVSLLGCLLWLHYTRIANKSTVTMSHKTGEYLGQLEIGSTRFAESAIAIIIM